MDEHVNNDAPGQPAQEQETILIFQRSFQRKSDPDEQRKRALQRAQQLRGSSDPAAAGRVGRQARRRFGAPVVRFGRVQYPPRHRFR